MKIEELNQYGDFGQPLIQLYQRVGNRSTTGYLGEDLKVQFDSDGRVQYNTHKELDEMNVDSQGVLLNDSILIKQVQRGHDFSSYRLYSWDTSENMYTYISFDQETALNRFFGVIKRFDANLCVDDISSSFQNMGLSFDNVNQILLKQRPNPLDWMLEEEEEKRAPFTM